MGKFFNLDSPVMRVLGKAADLMILNLVFIACCLPIVTIGASITALSYVTLKMADGTEGYIVKSFFKSFKQNFRQATVIWLVLLVLGVAIGLDFYLASSLEGNVSTVIRFFLMVSGMVYLMIFIYVFPLLARFYNTIAGTLKNALLISIGNLPRTLLAMVIIIASVVLTFWNGYTLSYGLMVWVLMGFALVAFVNSKIQNPVLAKYMPPEEEDSPSEESIVEHNDRIE